VLTAELPGISMENIEIHMAEGVLTLKGKKEEERRSEDKERTYHLWEREYGSFERTFRFPLEIAEDKVSAEFANGVLTVRVPKLQQQKAPPRTVPIAKR
jgi:HSP20 family protein